MWREIPGVTQVDEKGHEGNTAVVTANLCWRKLLVWSFQLRQLRIVSGLRRNMGYIRVGCRAGVLAHLVSLPCSLPCGTDNQDYENHLYVDCPGVGQVARGLRTEDCRITRRSDRTRSALHSRFRGRRIELAALKTSGCICSKQNISKYTRHSTVRALNNRTRVQ